VRVSTTNDHPISQTIREICVITSDFGLVEALQQLPIALIYRVHSGTEPDLVRQILREKPHVIVVVSSGSSRTFVSAHQICKEFKRQCSIPVVLLHNEEYQNMDIAAFSEMDTKVPNTYSERFNLLVELARLAFNVQHPNIALTYRRSFRWRLILGSATALLTTILAFIATGEIEMAILSGASAFSAITGVEMATYTRRLSRRSLSG